MKNQGFTLIEILVAIAILAVISLAVGALFPPVMRLNATSTGEQRATLASKAYFEALRGELRDNTKFDNAATTVANTAVPGTDTALVCTKDTTPTNVVAVPLVKGGAEVGVLKRFTLSCAIQNRTYAFTLDIARKDLNP